LLYAYISETSRRELADFRAQLVGLTSARQRFFRPLRLLVPWLEQSGFRGCPFQNIVVEAPPNDDRVASVARQHRQGVRMLLRELVDDLAREDASLARLDRDALADTYLILFEGAIALAVAYREPWPVHQAEATLEHLLATTS